MGYNKEEASKKIKLVIKQINGLPDEVDEDGNETELIPEIAIGSGEKSYYIHCYSLSKKRFINITSVSWLYFRYSINLIIRIIL